MTLEGTLDAFSLPDIFQLLSFTKKTGTLRITGASTSGVVHFAAGSVTGATSDVVRQGLGRRLVGAGLVDDEKLALAVTAVQDSPGLGLGKALHDLGALDDGVLHEQVVEQATDSVFDLLRWSSGEFAFMVDEPNPDDLGVSLPVDEVIAEGRRRLETWETLIRSVPAPDAVVSVATVPHDEGVSLTADEWRLLALVDGRRTVADLVRLSGRGEFATVRTVASLVTRDLVTVRPATEESRDGIAALLRRQAQLSALEGRPEPVAEPPATPATPAMPAMPAMPATPAVPAMPAVAETVAPQRPASVPDVVPQRPEPIVARAPMFPEEPVRRPAPVTPADATTGSAPSAGAAVATANDTGGAVIERDPSVNKSLLLRLIAGVRGL